MAAFVRRFIDTTENVKMTSEIYMDVGFLVQKLSE